MPNVLSYISFTPPPSPSEVLYETFFESLDGSLPSAGGSGNVSTNWIGFFMSTGVTMDSFASIKKGPLYHPLALTFDLKRSIVAHLVLDIADPVEEENFFCTGDFIDGGKSFGFRFTPDKIKGFCENEAGKVEVDLWTDLVVPWHMEGKFEAILYPGSRIAFFLSNVFMGQITTGLPTGFTWAEVLFSAKVKNQSESENMLGTSYLRVIQWT